MRKNLKNLIVSAVFLALGLVLPFFTAQIPEIGNMLLPMHLPVFLCGLICGYKYGAATGFVLPLMRALIFGMPPIYPVGIAMAFELMVYGLVSGLIYDKFREQNVLRLYITLLAAMTAGRIVWGLVMALLLGIGGQSFTLQMFVAGAFLNALPGIIVQLMLIPTIMLTLDRAEIVNFKRIKTNKKAKRLPN